MQITEALQNLGLSEKEARVYTALLKLGRGSAYGIADEAGIKRPTTYVILDELRQKGLVLKVPRVKKQLFIAKPPDELFAVAEEKLRVAKDVLPQLLAMAEGETQKPRTLFYEGLPAVRDVFLEQAKRMADRELTGFYAHAGSAKSEMLEFFDEYNERIKRYKVQVRGIAPEHPNLEKYRRVDAEYGRKMKIVPFEEYSSDISIDIGENYVMFFSIQDAQATLIENERIAKTMKQIFEMVWKSRPEQAQGAVEHAGEK